MGLYARASLIGQNMGTGLLGKLCASRYDYVQPASNAAEPVLLVRVVGWLPDNEKGYPVSPQHGRWLVIEGHHTDSQIENTHHLACRLFLEHEHAELMRDGKGGPSPYYPRH